MCVVGGDQNVTHQEEERMNDDLPDINKKKSGPALARRITPGMTEIREMKQ